MTTTEKKVTLELRRIGEIANRLDDIEETLAECQDSTRAKMEEVQMMLETATEAIDNAVEKVTQHQPPVANERNVSPSKETI